MTMTHNNYHTPVLLEECITGLCMKPDGVYLDCTLGGGGHFKEIVKRLDSGTAIGIDRDSEAVEWVKKNLSDRQSKIILEQCRFSEFDTVLKNHCITAVDGILMDLGVSSRQIDDVNRGFSYKESGALLDMRMNASDTVSAADIIANSSKKQLAKILEEFGEVMNSERMAEAFIRFSKIKALNTTGDLKECLEKEYGAPLKFKVLSKVFQAFRIAVNNELSELELCLQKTITWLKKGGRLVIIAYHSLEDRIVKEFLKNNEGHCTCPPYQLVCSCESVALFKRINKKVIIPLEKEVQVNPRARSARLRIAEKTA